MTDTERVRELEAQVAALDAALQRVNSRIARYCATCEGRDDRNFETYCTSCPLAQTQADVDARAHDIGQQ